MSLRRRQLLAVSLTSVTAGCVSRADAFVERVTGERRRKHELVETYDRGLVAYNAGVQTLEVAIGYEDWARTAERIPGSFGAFETAEGRFGDAEEQARDLRADRAIRICQHAIERTLGMQEAARVALEAAELFADGRPAAGDERWAEFLELRDRAQQVRMYATRDLAFVLGLTG